jgi:hypothetical protein
MGGQLIVFPPESFSLGSLVRTVCLTLLACLSGTSFSLAQAENGVDGEVRKDVLAFADKHHPELGKLLRTLEDSQPKEFRSAINDLNKTRDRLVRSQERTPDRYPLELKEWQLESRIRLLAARMAMGSDDGLEDQIRKALKERREIRMKLLKHEESRLRDRLERIDRQLEALEKSSDGSIDTELAALRKSALGGGKSGGGNAKKSVKTSPQKTSDAKKVVAPKKE